MAARMDASIREIRDHLERTHALNAPPIHRIAMLRAAV
jgi:hypothetical protein